MKRSLENRLRSLEESESDRDGETPLWVPFDRETDLELTDEEREALDEAFDVEPDTGTERVDGG